MNDVEEIQVIRVNSILLVEYNYEGFDEINIGDTVKVTGLTVYENETVKESFWVLIFDKKNDGSFIGTINNNLEYFELNFGEYIELELYNVKEHHSNKQIEEKGKELRQKIESQGINDAFIEAKKQLSSSKLKDITKGYLVQLKLKDGLEKITILVLFNLMKDDKENYYGISYNFYKNIRESLGNINSIKEIKENQEIKLYSFKPSNIIQIIRKKTDIRDNILALFI